VRHSPPFVLWVLCLDAETHRTLSNLGLDQVELVRLAELEQADPALLAAKPGRQAVEYYWTCGPSFLLHMLERCPGAPVITYLDTDLFFFGDPTPIYQELGSGTVLLTENRRSSRSRTTTDPLNQKGRYNVGLLVFRRTEEALACLRRWREHCLEWCFYRLEPTRFGDQKYLDEWPSRYGGVVVSRHAGAGLAVWNVGNYTLSAAQGRVLVERVPLVFYHFSNLRMITPWLCNTGFWRHGERMDRMVKRHVYLPYLQELRAARRLIRAAGGEVHPVDSLSYGRSRLLLLARGLWHRSLLVVTDAVAL
jgi:hypothetical protein